jgi:uncharacterized protein YjbI with pentapeptide repeats
LSGSNIFEGIFARSILYRADMTGCDLRDAIFIGAFLQEVDLSGSDLTGADLTRAKIDGVKAEGTRGFQVR